MWTNDTYESDLFGDVHAVDILLAVSCERAVGHHGVLSAFVGVVDGDDHGEIILDRLAEFECSEVVDVESDGARGHFLFKTRADTHVMDVVLPVGRVEHLGRIVRVLLLRHTHVDADVGVADRVVLEGEDQLVVFIHMLHRHKVVRKNVKNKDSTYSFDALLVEGDLDVEVFEVVVLLRRCTWPLTVFLMD